MRELTDDERDVVECNMGLVGLIVSSTILPGEDWDDLFQAAIFGLSRAVQTCDAEKGGLTTHAGQWIRQAIQRHRLNHRALIRVPVYLQTEAAKQAERPEYVAAMNSVANVGTLYFDDGDPDDPTDDRHIDPLDAMIEREALAGLRHAIGHKLSNKHRQVMAQRLAGKSLGEIGESMGGVSKEYVRRIKVAAMAKLREHMAEYA